MENEAIPVAEYEKLTEKFRVHGLLRPQGLREGPRGRVRGGRQGLRGGFYYSLMDWHHPDGARCAEDEGARRRFVDYIHGQVRELQPDIPLGTSEQHVAAEQKGRTWEACMTMNESWGYHRAEGT